MSKVISTPELIAMVVSHLGKSDLASCLRVSPTFFVFAGENLYARLYCEPHGGPYKQFRHPFVSIKNPADVQVSNPEEYRYDKSKLLTWVRVLDIFHPYHLPRVDYISPTIELPNLRVLRIDTGNSCPNFRSQSIATIVLRHHNFYSRRSVIFRPCTYPHFVGETGFVDKMIRSGLRKLVLDPMMHPTGRGIIERIAHLPDLLQDSRSTVEDLVIVAPHVSFSLDEDNIFTRLDDRRKQLWYRDSTDRLRETVRICKKVNCRVTVCFEVRQWGVPSDDIQTLEREIIGAFDRLLKAENPDELSGGTRSSEPDEGKPGKESVDERMRRVRAITLQQYVEEGDHEEDFTEAKLLALREYWAKRAREI